MPPLTHHYSLNSTEMRESLLIVYTENGNDGDRSYMSQEDCALLLCAHGHF